MCISGFDPSGGAGILSDIKTLEAHGVYGVGVCTAMTIQTESDFLSIRWEAAADILSALNKMLMHYEVEVVKVGIVENFEVLDSILSCIKEQSPEIKIIWDPVIRSTTGYRFWNANDERGKLNSLLEKVYLITPNFEEALSLFPSDSARESALTLSQYCSVLLKGGHDDVNRGRDTLFVDNIELIFESGNETVFPKHGSGCVLSSSIAANLSVGFDLKESIIKSKEYITQFLSSNESLLGYHNV